MSRLTTLDFYIARRTFVAILGVFTTITLLVFTLDFVELIRRTGETPAATGSVLVRLAFYRTPSVVERILPFVIQFGAMIAFLLLSRRLELVVARSAGVSVWNILRPAIVIAFGLGVLSVVAFNPLAANWRNWANDMEARLFPQNAAGREEGLWLRQRSETGYGVIRATRSFESGRTLTDVTFFLFDNDGRFRERITAESAELVGLQWRLTQATIFPADRPPYKEERFAVATNLRPDFVRRSFTLPENVSFWRLPQEAADSAAAGFDSTKLRLQYHRLLAQPLLFVAMVIIASTVSLGFFRLGGVARMVLVGVAAGFVLYIVKKLVEDLGSVGILWFVVAAWTPAILGNLVGILVLLHQEDG